MKANEVPEKIQIHFIKNDYDAWSVRGYSFLEDKQMGMIGYTRTDAFIEKTRNWLIEHINEYLLEEEGTSRIDIKWLIRDLKNLWHI